jgi:hypothetical protein
MSSEEQLQRLIKTQLDAFNLWRFDCVRKQKRLLYLVGRAG